MNYRSNYSNILLLNKSIRNLEPLKQKPHLKTAVIKFNYVSATNLLYPRRQPLSKSEEHQMSFTIPFVPLPVIRNDYNGNSLLRDSVSDVDPEIYNLMQNEKDRQRRGLQLIASENFPSKSVSDALSSCLSCKYSEGYPGHRYYAGNEFIDQIEILCQDRALQLFGLDNNKWYVNVQPLSGSPANFAVYAAIAEQHGRIMGLELSDGGHLTHGFYTPTKKVSCTSVFFESLPYRVSTETGLIDYDKLEENAMLYRPKIIIAGISCYTRWLDYARFRKIADKCGAYLMADMAHIAGLVAGGAAPSPFEYADIVTTTTHKTLRGPRGALIFARKGLRSVNNKGEEIMYDLGSKIDATIFPGLQGGPHNHTIAAIAVALKQCLTNEFKSYASQVIKNAQALALALSLKGYKLVTGGTDNHIVLIDIRPKNMDASRLEVVLDMARITTNKNTCPGDKSALKPGGIRVGTAGLTSRGFKETDFEFVAELVHRAIQIFQKYELDMGKTNKEFNQFIHENEAFLSEIRSLANEVAQFAQNFELPGNDKF